MAVKLLDPHGRAIPSAAERAERAAALAGDKAYRAASARDQVMSNWNPLPVSADGASLWDRTKIVARVRDLIRNSGLARAAVVKQADMVVGHQWRLVSLPDATALGLTREEAAGIGRQIEAAFRKWADDPDRRCDRVRRHRFAGLVNLLYRERRTAGEDLTIIRRKARPGWDFETCLQVIDAERMGNPHNRTDRADLRGGVRLDDAGEPLGYWIRNGHQFDVVSNAKSSQWTYVPRQTSWGRPVCVHGFDSERPEQSRGISPFAPVLASFRMLERHADAEIASAVANALFVAFISSSWDPAAVQEGLGIGSDGKAQENWQDIRMGIHEAVPQYLGGSRIPVMPPGDEIKMNHAPRQTSAYGDFRASFLQEVASALGMPYVSLAERWDKVNYSSARAALNETWRAVQSQRGSFVEQTITPIYAAVMEEAFAKGMIDLPAGAPSFYAAKGAYLRGMWVGPGRGYIDGLKERQASKLGLENNMTTLQKELADQGLDYEEVLDQRAREITYAAELDLGPTLGASVPKLDRRTPFAGRYACADLRADQPEMAETAETED